MATRTFESICDALATMRLTPARRSLSYFFNSMFSSVLPPEGTVTFSPDVLGSM
jgi:hypothetical protein